MLDQVKTAQVRSGLLEISKIYKRPRFMFTRDKVQFEDAIKASTFVGNYSLDDLALLDKVNELLQQTYVLIIAEEQSVNVYVPMGSGHV